VTATRVLADGEEFLRSADPYRAELLAYCYRMMGSVHDAEDLVQETLLRAWRARPRFDERRASLRTWLYRIATNACLTALAGGHRRPLPAGLVGASTDPDRPLGPREELPWLQPFPDALLPADPAVVVASRAGIRLALIAAWQYLPPKQRAVLILRDVLAWPAAEVAELLDTTTAAVNSALQRARAQLAEVDPVEDGVAEPDQVAERALLDRYVAAFVEADVTTLVQLLRDDVTLEMPPYLTWFAGRTAVGAFLSGKARTGLGTWRMFATRANDQPAALAYRRGPDGVLRPHSVQVLTVAGGGVARFVVFSDPGLLAAFGWPPTLPG
jgi:RNA polymerase sigma-70 factor (ECF subfamily)